MGNYLLLHLVGMIFVFSSLVSSDQLLVIGETGELLVTPSLQVKGSPRLNQDLITLFERINIRGFPRFHHIHKYAHSLKLIVNTSTATTGKTINIHVCFHGNLSLAIGMCPQDRWEKISNVSWIKTMSLFDHRIIDVRIASESNIILKVSTVQEWFMFRIVFLIIGTVLMTWASTLSKSFTFYYISVFTVGVILAALLLLFQVVKHLPTRLSYWGFFLYSSLLALSYVILPHIPSFLLSIVRLMGSISGLDEYHMLLLGMINLHQIGIAFGIVVVHSQLLLTPDGSIDINTSLFISWSTWILAAVLIFQSSKDGHLALGALIFLIIMSPMLRRVTGLIFPQRRREILMNLISEGLCYVLGPTVFGFARDLLQTSVESNLKRSRTKGIDYELDSIQKDYELDSIQNDYELDSIQNDKQNHDQHLQPNQTYYTCLTHNLDMDTQLATTLVGEFRTFTNDVTNSMLAMKRAQDVLLRANGIDPETLLLMVPSVNPSVDVTHDTRKPLDLADSNTENNHEPFILVDKAGQVVADYFEGDHL
ncbi:hypothetical protein V5N11_006642 [Cardamine amara subsp. amara]|uniref:Uncharacterized protein n=1 Tax=Cardamine amara subsp. amara TaxID=228776 RepID=A0ABD1AU94_CARAN